MYQWAALSVTAIILIILMIRKPLWLIPLLAAAVALEISSTWYPNLGAIGGIMGMVSLTRFTSFALILAAFFRLLFLPEMRRKLFAVIKDPINIILMTYLFLGAASMIYSADLGSTISETIRLLVLFAVFISIALLIDKERALVPFHAVHLTAVALAPLSFYESFTGNLIWQSTGTLSSAVRINATFVDPNIFARYIILGIVANFVLQIYSRDKSHRPVYMATLAILLAQLALTASRGGILTLFAVLILTLIFLPNRKAVLWVLGLGVLCGALVVFIRPDIWDRMLLLTKGFEVSNPQRLYLWKAAIAIFKDHLISGTGLGTFQTVFLTDYSHFKTAADTVTLSHTTILTIAAELGITGLVVLTAFWLILCGRMYSLYGIGGSHLSIFNNFNNEYYVGAGYFLWALTVFISSQGEGRFFEDPILWLSCACLVVLKFDREYNINLD